MAKIDEQKLEAIVAQQIELAHKYDRDERETDRAKALDYFLGQMDEYISPEPNRSKVVSKDVADVIGWVHPQVMRVFTASDKMGMAEPVGEEDIPFARQATDGMNHVFWKENRGYEIVYNATWDALLVGNGIVKTYWDDTPVWSTSFHSGLSEEQLALLLMPNEDGETPDVLQHEMEERIVIDEASGQQFQSVEYDVKIRRKKFDGRIVVEVIPPERFLIDQDAIFTDEAAFTAHWEQKTRSELVEMGYDKKTVAAIPETGTNQTPEEASRNSLLLKEGADASMELVDYYECYIRIDIDDDGEAELIRACFGGKQNGTLLDWEIWEDELPFDDIPCDPVPHRWVAKSISDDTMDLQDIRTTLWRQGLNSAYWSNNPQRFAKGKIENKEELVNPTFGGTIFGDINSSVEPLPVPNMMPQAFEALTYTDEMIQRRTGIGRNTMAMDADALQNQTAEAVRDQRAAGLVQTELLARNMAEWGWRKVFRKIMKLMIKHQNNPRLLMINGKKTQIDPRSWNTDMDVTINVGLGTGSRDRDMMMTGQIIQQQTAMAQQFDAAGMVEQAIDMLPKIVQSCIKFAESAGIRNPEEYYPEFDAQKIQALKQQVMQAKSQPDPKIAAEQQKAQMDAMAKDAQAKRDHEYRMSQLKAKEDMDRIAAENKLALDKYQTDQELVLKQYQIDQELRLKSEMGMVDAFNKTNSNLASSVHVGGEPG